MLGTQQVAQDYYCFLLLSPPRVCWQRKLVVTQEKRDMFTPPCPGHREADHLWGTGFVCGEDWLFRVLASLKRSPARLASPWHSRVAWSMHAPLEMGDWRSLVNRRLRQLHFTVTQHGQYYEWHSQAASLGTHYSQGTTRQPAKPPAFTLAMPEHPHTI